MKTTWQHPAHRRGPRPRLGTWLRGIRDRQLARAAFGQTSGRHIVLEPGAVTVGMEGRTSEEIAADILARLAGGGPLAGPPVYYPPRVNAHEVQPDYVVRPDGRVTDADGTLL